jgi:hypothetical protein
MEYCLHNGKVYFLNEYGLYEKSSLPAENITTVCNDGIFVSPYISEKLFIYGNKLIKCTNAIEKSNYEKLGHHLNFLDYFGTIDSQKGPCILLEYLPESVDFDELYGTFLYDFPTMVN